MESRDDDSKPMFLPARRVGSIVPSVMSVSPGFQATKNFMHANLRQSVPVIRQPYHFGNHARVSYMPRSAVTDESLTFDDVFIVN